MVTNVVMSHRLSKMDSFASPEGEPKKRENKREKEKGGKNTDTPTRVKHHTK